ncbi:MAG: hypothetical protein EP330_23215 [Deltaproteobacteria bacterium]|nr:MAG: hypothetical protein EP330_23215 [Deltaproteobacteria bacterium]
MNRFTTIAISTLLMLGACAPDPIVGTWKLDVISFPDEPGRFAWPQDDLFLVIRPSMSGYWGSEEYPVDALPLGDSHYTLFAREFDWEGHCWVGARPELRTSRDWLWCEHALELDGQDSEALYEFWPY